MWLLKLIMFIYQFILFGLTASITLLVTISSMLVLVYVVPYVLYKRVTGWITADC